MEGEGRCRPRVEKQRVRDGGARATVGWCEGHTHRAPWCGRLCCPGATTNAVETSPGKHQQEGKSLEMHYLERKMFISGDGKKTNSD